MKDEELADEYARHEQCAHCINPQYCQGEEDCYRFADVKNHFLAGLKAGKPQWHDLRENPNDLPSDELLVLCIDKVWTGQTFTTLLKCCDGVFIDGNGTPYDVIAWYELPTFDKE